MNSEAYLAKRRAENPYLGALLDAIKDVPIGDIEQMDRILLAFPEEDEWYAQQQQKEHDGE